MAHPTSQTSGVSVDHGIIRNITGNHTPGSYEAIVPQGDATNHRCVCPDGSASLHQCWPVFILSDDMTARIDDIRKHHRWPTKNVILKNDSRVNRHVILNFDVVSDNTVWRNYDVLADIAAISYDRILHDVTEVPDFCSFANATQFVYERRLMNKVVLSHVCPPAGTV
jgi:hypothetical protein